MSGFKKMILPWMVFNDDTLNIFTDGSIRKIQINGYDEETIGCAGAYAVSNDIHQCVDKKCTVIRQATNNITELMAIYEGLIIANRFKYCYNRINLFSDSKINIFGLREWIYKWIVDPNTDKLVNSSGKEPMNLKYIAMIIEYILSNNININLYHINGHIDINKQKDIIKAHDTFMLSNHLSHPIDFELIKMLAIGNDIVDIFTGEIIENKLRTTNNNTVVPLSNVNPDSIVSWELSPIISKPLFSYEYSHNMDMVKYKNLVK